MSLWKQPYETAIVHNLKILQSLTQKRSTALFLADLSGVLTSGFFSVNAVTFIWPAVEVRFVLFHTASWHKRGFAVTVCWASLDRGLFKHQLMTGKFFKDCATHWPTHAALWLYQADQSVHWLMRRNVSSTTFNSVYFMDTHAEVWYAKSCFSGFSNSFPSHRAPHSMCH